MQKMAANKLLFNSVDELLPHEGEIILLTEVLAWGDDWLEARVDHRKPSLFKQENGTVPAWVGLEYMAQTIGALIGIHAKKAGEPIRIGFLMGTQKYETSVSEFAKDSVLTVRVDEIFTENNLALFDCSVRSDVVLAAAQIKAVRPEDLDSVLEGI
jgi:predicted hotdog family 3-hydroxylacyl-ACP dehydratase